MTRVLLTGMSGTGKSTVVRALSARGHRAIDLDTDAWSEWVTIDGASDPFDPGIDRDSVWHDRDWVWREDRVRRLLQTDDADLLFVSGTSSNQGMFHPHFDHIVLLSASPDVLVARLANRTTNAYGKDPEELARVLHHIQTFEPLLRRAATVEIDTSPALDVVVQAVLDAVLPTAPRASGHDAVGE